MNTFGLQTSRTFCGDPVGKIPPPNAPGQHLAALGIPIVNDKLYPRMSCATAEDDLSSPLQLLAKSISFQDPVTGQLRYFESDRKL
jgi:hypothetical protein